VTIAKATCGFVLANLELQLLSEELESSLGGLDEVGPPRDVDVVVRSLVDVSPHAIQLLSVAQEVVIELRADQPEAPVAVHDPLVALQRTGVRPDLLKMFRRQREGRALELDDKPLGLAGWTVEQALEQEINPAASAV
jgi:hypothetical protein